MYHLIRCLVLGHNNCMSFEGLYNPFLPWYEFEEAPNGALRQVEGTTEAFSFSEWENTSSGDPTDYYFASVSGGEPAGEGDEFNWGIPIGAVGTVISAGTEYADNLVRTSFKTGRNPVSWSKLTPKQQAWRTANV